MWSRSMWRDFVDRELGWWCVRPWRKIVMVHRSMGNGLRVTDEPYIWRGCLTLEDFLFFSLGSFSCVTKQVTTLKQLRLLPCPDFVEMKFEPFCLGPISPDCYQHHLRQIPLDIDMTCPICVKIVRSTAQNCRSRYSISRMGYVPIIFIMANDGWYMTFSKI